MSGWLLCRLAWRFGLMSFLAIGGINAIVPEINRQVVEVERWVSATEFAALFAIASAAPGPNVLIVTLVGWRVAGIAGALVATIAAVAPTGLLAYGVFRVWDRFRVAPWRRAVENGLAAVTVGLIAASGWLLADAAVTGIATAAILLATVVVAVFTRLNPLWSFAAAAAIGAVALGGA